VSSTKIVAGIILVIAVASAIILHDIFPYLDSGFRYHKHEVLSFDNLYSVERGGFMGNQLSKTIFSYGVVDEKDGILLVKSSFDVRTLADKPIFSVERVYGINSATGEHVPGYGDKDRQGYLFAPKNLKEGQPFTVWHINYDVPAHMEFKAKEKIEGITVYLYEANFQADQTKELDALPDVPEKYGITLDVNLKYWVDPVTGQLITYEDHTNAYYYDIKTGQKVSPWNTFSNRMTLPMVKSHVAKAVVDKRKIFAVRYGIPALIAMVGTVLIAASLAGKKPPLKRKSHK